MVLGDAPFGHQAKQVAVGADIVEAVVVNAGVGEVRRHERDGSIAADFEELALAGGVELENGRAELEALRPLGPAAAGVLPAQR